MAGFWARLSARWHGSHDEPAEAALPQPPEAREEERPAPIAPEPAPDDHLALMTALTPETLSLIKEMSSYANFVDIMQRHLDNVCSGTQRAAEDIMGQVLLIESDLGNLVGHVSETMHSEEFLDASDAVINSIGQGHAMIGELIRQHQENQCRIRESLAEVNRLSGRMKDHLEDIEKIRRHTDLLAINARIRIASLGQQTGLDVIAQEIRALATQTGELAHNLRHELKDMDAMVSDRLTRNFIEQEQRDNSCTTELQSTFDKLSENMNRMISMQGTLIQTVRSRAENMGEPLMNLCGSIQFQDVARQQIEQVGQALEMISDHFVSLSQAIINGEAPPDSSIARCLAHILVNYVMEEQRAAHSGPSVEQASGVPIELF